MEWAATQVVGEERCGAAEKKESMIDVGVHKKGGEGRGGRRSKKWRKGRAYVERER